MHKTLIIYSFVRQSAGQSAIDFIDYCFKQLSYHHNNFWSLITSCVVIFLKQQTCH